eukprot:228659-Rhodomonas_salina.1
MFSSCASRRTEIECFRPCWVSRRALITEGMSTPGTWVPGMCIPGTRYPGALEQSEHFKRSKSQQQTVSGYPGTRGPGDPVPGYPGSVSRKRLPTLGIHKWWDRFRVGVQLAS